MADFSFNFDALHSGDYSKFGEATNLSEQKALIETCLVDKPDDYGDMATLVEFVAVKRAFLIAAKSAEVKDAEDVSFDVAQISLEDAEIFLVAANTFDVPQTIDVMGRYTETDLSGAMSLARFMQLRSAFLTAMLDLSKN